MTIQTSSIFQNEYAISQIISKSVLKATESENHISKLCDHYFTDEFGQGKTYTVGESIQVPMPVHGQAFIGRRGKATPKKVKLANLTFSEDKSWFGYMRNIGSYEAALLTKDAKQAQKFASEIADGRNAMDVIIQKKIIDIILNDVSAAQVGYDGELYTSLNAESANRSFSFASEYGLSSGEYTCLLSPKMMADLKITTTDKNYFEEPLNKDLIRNSKCGRLYGFDWLQVNAIEPIITETPVKTQIDVKYVEVFSNNNGILHAVSSANTVLKKGEILYLSGLATIDTANGAVDSKVYALRSTDKISSRRPFTCIVQEDVALSDDTKIKVSEVPIPNKADARDIWDYNDARNITTDVAASQDNWYRFFTCGSYEPIYCIKPKTSIKFVNPFLAPLNKGVVSHTERSKVSNIALRVSMQDSIDANKDARGAGIEASTMRLSTLADGLCSNIASFVFPIFQANLSNFNDLSNPKKSKK